ncbi:MAG TPA: nuclear transport factor 2 family protein [Candidatus Dormibacteraeota bacterium]
MSTSTRPVHGVDQRAALDAHVAAENAHDLDALMATFAPDAVMEVNQRRFDSPEAIRTAHERMGFGPDGGGGIAGLRVVEGRRTFTDDGIVVEGRITARQVTTGREVALPYCVIYQFDAAGLLYSERAYLDLRAVAGG